MSVFKFILRHAWLVLMVIYLALAAWPATHWYDPGRLEIHDTVQGEQIELLYQGGAVRTFFGSYTVIMRDFETQGVVCEARSGFFTYKPEAERPDPITMEWWAAGDYRCYRPPVGNYITETCWTISGVLWGIVPPKHICATPVSHSVRAPE